MEQRIEYTVGKKLGIYNMYILKVILKQGQYLLNYAVCTLHSPHSSPAGGGMNSSAALPVKPTEEDESESNGKKKLYQD